MSHNKQRLHQHRAIPPVQQQQESPDAARLRNGSGPGGMRTPEDDVPAGKVWTPDAASYVSKRKQAELQVPSFIPLKLDGNLSPAQRDIAASVVSEQIKQGSRAPNNIPQALLPPGTKVQDLESRSAQPVQPTQSASEPSNMQTQQPQQPQQNLPTDFDPEVDDPDDIVVGSQALAPDTVAENQREALQEALRQKQIAKAQQQATGNRAQAPGTVHSDVDVSKRPGIMQEHPLLAKLRSRYTISALDIRYKTIDGIKYGFRKHSNQAYLKFVTNKVLPTIETEAELSDKHAYALAAISLASVDDVPAWEVFGAEIDPVVERAWIAAEPLNPPTTVVIKTADIIYHMFIMDGIPEFGDTLARAYNELFPDIDIVGDDGTWIYKCMTPGCHERFEHVPENDSDGNPKPYYCPVHGTALRPLGSKGDLRNVPLD